MPAQPRVFGGGGSDVYNDLGNLKITSLNCRSLNLSETSLSDCKGKLNWVISNNSDICFLSEVKFHDLSLLPNIKRFLSTNNLGSYDLYLNSTGSRRGTAIIIRKKLDIHVVTEFRDKNENFILLECRLNNNNILLGSIYAPNDDQSVFFTDLESALSRFNSMKTILGGDWNTCLSSLPPDINPDIDRHNGFSNNGATLIANLCRNFHITDPFRVRFPNKREFSYRRKVANGTSRSRIDFFLISNDLLSSMSDTGYTPSPSFFFDHFATFINFKSRVPKKYVKKFFISETACESTEVRNAAMLQVVNFISINSLTELAPTFTAIAVRMNTIHTELRSIDDKTSPRYFELLADFRNYFLQISRENDFISPSFGTSNLANLEVLLNNIKMDASNLSFLLHKKRNEALQAINEKIHNFVLTPNNRNELDTLEEKQQKEMSLLLEFSKSKSILNNCLNSCNSSANISKAINAKFSTPTSVIKDENNVPFASEKERADHIVNFFKSIYSKTPSNVTSIRDSLNDEALHSIPKLSALQCQSLTAIITNDEVRKVINSLGSNTAPGLDCIPNKLIKNTFDLYINLMTNAFNDVLAGTSSFPDSFKTSKIIMIPKKSNPTSVKNWRPISLGSSVFKIYNKIIAKRISKVLPSLVGPEQKAYLRSVNISETTANIFEYCSKLLCAESKPDPVNAFLVSIDWKKAFDSVHHHFIVDCLRTFGFPPQFISVVERWMSGRRSCINLDGSESDFFDITCGVPQGDALSGFIFILTIAIFTIMINSVPNIHVNLNHPAEKNNLNSEIFADDTAVIVNGTDSAFKDFLNLIAKFSELSGLYINSEKTAIMAYGNLPALNKIATDNGYNTCSEFSHLGITIDRNLKLDTVWDSKVRKCENLINLINALHPSFTNKIQIVKTFLISQFNYIAAILPPTKKQITNIEKLILKFLYPGYPIAPLFSKDQTFTTRDKGGLGIPPPGEFFFALRTKFCFRAQSSVQPWALTLKSNFLDQNLAFHHRHRATELSKFTLDRIDCVKFFQLNYFKDDKRFWSAPIFMSHLCSQIQRPFNILNIPRFVRESGIINASIADIFDFNQRSIIDYTTFSSRFRNININFYYLTNTLLRHMINNATIPSRKPDPQKLQTLIAKNPKAGILRNKIQSSVKFDIFSHHSAINNFNYANANRNDDIAKKDYINFVNSWCKGFFSAELREHALRFTGGKMKMNQQRRHWGGVNQSCRFCLKNNIQNPAPENIKHIFLQCPVVQPLITTYFNPLRSELGRENGFLFVGSHSCELTEFINLDILMFSAYIINCISRHARPSLAGLVNMMNIHKTSMRSNSNRYRFLSDRANTIFGPVYAAFNY